MAFTSQQIVDYLLANPGMTDAQIVAAMETFQISPAQMASAVGLDEGAVAARVGAAIPPNQAVLLGDTYVQAVNQTIGSGEDQQVGGLENVITYKAGENQAGGGYQQYTPTGELQRTGVQQEVNANQDFLKFALGAGALFGGAALAGAGGGAATVGTTGLTMAELAQLDLALGGAGGTAGATSLANALTTGANVGLLRGGADVTTSTAREFAAANAASSTIPAATSVLTPTATGALTSTATGALTPAATSVLTPAATSLLAPAAVSALTPTATNIATSLIPTAVNKLLTPTNIGNLVQSGATTASGLLQQQTSREAAQRAQQMIDAETAAAKQAAAFRPIGMTTRFGTSQFQVDPVTGQLISAGYTLDPQAKNAQDRFVALAEQGLQQAEGAQKAFEPLQLGAQSLFKLGQGYLAQSPEQVAQDYLKNQMSLLQPSREIELANLQTKLRNQGRIGLSVAQGGDLGATTPELQALFNARARQEAELAANAQLAGQRDVLFGAGLYDLGTKSLGNYYAGQGQAYAPYTTAMGQVTGLEALGQQPLNMSTALAQQTSQAGANVGRLGLSGAEFSTRLATSPAATTNPYSTLLGGVGASNQFGQFVGGLLGGTPATTAMSAPATTFGTGNYYGSQDLGLYL